MQRSRIESVYNADSTINLVIMHANLVCEIVAI